MFKKGEYIIITGSSEKRKKGECTNWCTSSDGMNKFTNKVVQLTESTDSRGNSAYFNGSGIYTWNYTEGHFRKATPEEIAAECLVETPIVVNDYSIF